MVKLLPTTLEAGGLNLGLDKLVSVFGGGKGDICHYTWGGTCQWGVLGGRSRKKALCPPVGSSSLVVTTQKCVWAEINWHND